MSIHLPNIPKLLGKAVGAAAHELSDEAKAAVGGLVHKAEDAFDKSGATKAVKLLGAMAYAWGKERTATFEVIRKPELPAPPEKGELTVASYNILLGGKNIDQVEKDLRALNPDVVCLQETSRESALRLGEKLGMHVAFSSLERAVLSRYPIVKAESANHSVPWGQRWDAAYQSGNTEPLETRSLVQATLQVGGRQLDVIDTHLSLGDPASNAMEIQQLTDRIERLKAEGHAVVVAGDFNANFAFSGQGQQDAPGTVATPTDTAGEFKERYPKSVVGNAGDARVKQAMDRLDVETQDQWEAQVREVKTGEGTITPEQAMAELRSGVVPKGSERWQLLIRVVDGVTHQGANKRFDNLFAAGGVQITRATVDYTASGSDHQPVVAQIEWK